MGKHKKPEEIGTLSNGKPLLLLSLSLYCTLRLLNAAPALGEAASVYFSVLFDST